MKKVIVFGDAAGVQVAIQLQDAASPMASVSLTKSEARSLIKLLQAVIAAEDCTTVVLENLMP